MIRIVADTSTLISAVGWEGKPQEIMNKCLDKKLKLVSSPEILGEIREVFMGRTVNKSKRRQYRWNCSHNWCFLRGLFRR